MQNYSVISKGAYVRPQTENFVAVTSFLFIRQDGKKYLLLKLKNSRAEAVEEVNLKVTLLDKKGQTMKVLHLSSDKCGASSFAFGEKIEVDDNCCDFIAKVESAVYGGYLYRDGKGGVAIDYDGARSTGFDVNKVKAAMHGKTRAVTDKRLGIPVAVSVLAFLLLVCATLVTYFQLGNFIENSTGFTYSGVEYVFVDPDKKAGTEIIVTGYRGTSSKVVIPKTIGGYVVSEIQDSAFEGNTKIKRLKIEGEIKIGGYAFAGCEKLSEVSLTDTVAVGENAFAGCTALTTLEISGSGENELGANAFKNCPALESVKIQQKINYPESLAVFTGSALVSELYLQNYGDNTISALFGGETPTMLKNLTVNYLDGICDRFCGYMTALENVTVAYVGDEEYGIGDYAFYGTNLQTLKIPLGVTSVGTYAFSGTQISSFNAYGVESIGEYAFSECGQLKSFTVPDSLTVLSDGAFSSCYALEKVTFENGENLAELGDYVFYNCASLQSITIPDSVEYIGRLVFGACTNLKSVTLPYLGSSAESSQSMEYFFGYSYDIPESVTLTSAVSLATRAFYGCNSLEEINLNEGLEYIGDSAFYGCVRLKSIVIPSTVRGSGYDIFDACYRLFEVYNLSGVALSCDYAIAVYSSLEQSVPKSEIGGYTVAYSDGAFAQPEGWYLIDYPKERFLTLPENILSVSSYSVIDYLFYNEKDLCWVNLSEAVNALGKYAFYCCPSLTSVSVPRTVTEIEENTFSYCEALERVNFFGDNISKVGDYAFYGCSALNEISLSGSAVTVGDCAFSGCYRMTSVSIEGVTSIGARAFFRDSALESVEISRARGNIGDYAFYECSSLTEIVIPDGVEQIGTDAFCGCTVLRKITLPVSLTAIGSYAFDECTRLRAVVNYSRLGISQDDNYGGVGKTAVFIVTNPSDAAALNYNETDGVTFLQFYSYWSAVWCEDSVTEINLSSLSGCSYLSIAPDAFNGNRNIRSADLSAVNEIGENAFYYSALKNVVLGSRLTYIGKNAFSFCTALTSVNLQDTRLTGLGAGAFFNCTALTTVSLPATLSEIPEQAFYYCSSLSDAVIPKSVTSVGADAFYGCFSLLQVHNLSRIAMSAGSRDYGYCAYYALCVFNDADSKMTFAEKDGYKFANYNKNWYLYGFSNYDYYKTLPESFIFENATVSSYIIRNGALGTAAYIIIPTSVSAIENNAVSPSATVYYLGTTAQWEVVRPSNSGSARVFYYSQCIHTDGGNLWTYSENGYPSTSRTALDWTVTKQANCKEDGVSLGKCPYCDFTDTQTIEKLYHSFDAEGKCVRCGEHGEFVQSASGTYDGYALNSNNFTVEDGKFTSTNTSVFSYATVTITATADLQIFFGCSVSSYYDSITITCGGETVDTVTSTYIREFEIELLKGQTLTLSYYKSYYYSSGNALISYILIFA